MTGEARNHHYIPQCYLRGFSQKKQNKSKLVVGDIPGRRFFETTPRNVGAERDFNRIEAEGVKPDMLETLWSDFEEKITGAIQEVDETGVLQGESKVIILNLAALFAVRHPAMRQNWQDFQEQVAKQVIGIKLSSKDHWAASLKATAEGVTPDALAAYDELKALHESDDYKIEVPRERHIKTEMRLIESVLPLLADRNWSIFRTNNGLVNFITSDRPLTLRWRNPDKLPFLMRRNPGFAMTDTEVLFPLSKKTVIAGTFDQPEISVNASIGIIANANTKSIEHAHKQIYCHSMKFPYYGASGKIHDDSNFFRHLLVGN